MRWMSWNCAPEPKKSRRDSLRLLQPELLEPRLALSHAPLTDYGAGQGQTDYGAGPGHDPGNQTAAFYSAPADGAPPSNGGQPFNSGPQFNGPTQSNNASLSNNNWNDFGSMGHGGYGGLDGQGADYSNPAAALNNSQDDDGARLVGAPPVQGFGPSAGPVFYGSTPAPTYVVYTIISSPVSVVYNVGAPGFGGAGGPSFEPPQGDDPAPVANLVNPSVGAVHALVAGAASAAGVNNASAALTFGLPAGSQPGTAQFSQGIVSPQNSTIESSRTIAPNASALSAVPGDLVYRGPASEALNVVSVAPLQEQPPGGHETSPAPAIRNETSRVIADTRESGGFELSSAEAPLSIRGALIAGMAPNFDALDRALEVALEEIEKMGGDLVTWLDASDSTAWITGGALVVLTSGGYYWQRRRVGRQTGTNLEEPSNWLFTHLYHPTGRP